ncbi:MAG TPA: FtsX-like permease family protein [Chryseosolibacter sp.]
MITGLMDDETNKSHLKFDALVSSSSMPALSNGNKIENLDNNWQYNRSYTYVMLNAGKSQNDLAVSLADAIHHKNEELKEIKGFELIPERLTDITPGRLVSNETRQTLPLVAYYFLAALALIILVSACLNYTSLSTARALTRAKEIGVRKVTGAFRKDLVYQFLGEAIITAVFALGLAMLMLVFLKSAFLQLSMNRYLQFSLESNPGIYIAFVLFAVCTGLAAGFYPALYLSRFRPVKAFRNTEGLASGKPTMRRMLAVCQFVISLFFITTSLLLFNQVRHFMQFDYGFTPDNIVNVSLQGNSYRRVSREFSSVPGVSSISACNYLPSTGTDNGMRVRQAGTDMEFERVIIMSTDEKFASNLGVRLVAGKHLEPTDSISHTILVNQAAVKAIGYRQASDIVGQIVEVEGSREQLEVVGVVEDFFVRMPSGEDKISPLVLRNQPREFKYANVKITSADPMAAVESLQKVWQRIDPYHPFQYRFYDEQLASINQGLFDIISITGFIAFLSVSIACLGLLGMVAYSSERKTKEVGIRKVLGAGGVGIAVLLSKDFLKILLVAIFIGAPLSFFVNNLWLQKFPNRVSFGLPTILLSTLMLLLLGLVTIASQTLAASRRNPVDVLKND